MTSKLYIEVHGWLYFVTDIDCKYLENVLQINLLQ